MAGWINDRELITLARTNKTPAVRTIAELKGVGDNRKMAAMGGGGNHQKLQSLTGSILRDPVNFVVMQQRCSVRPPPPPTGDK